MTSLIAAVLVERPERVGEVALADLAGGPAREVVRIIGRRLAAGQAADGAALLGVEELEQWGGRALVHELVEAPALVASFGRYLAEARRLAVAAELERHLAAGPADADRLRALAARLDAADGPPPPFVALETVDEVAVSWLWQDRLPLAAVSLLVGDGGLGKSTLLAEIAARITRGQGLPGGPVPAGPAAALLLGAEDSAGAVLRPRVRLAGGDLERVYVVDDDRLDGLVLPRDLPILEREIVRVGARFVAIDPLSAFLGAGVDSYRDTDVRRVLRPLRGVAERTGAAIVGVLHLNRRQGVGPMERINGSGAFGNAARMVLAFARHPEASDDGDPRRVIAVAKSNYGRTSPATPALTVMVAAPPGEDYPCIGWAGEAAGLGAREILGQQATDEERSARDEAEEFLRDALADGPRPAREVMAEARDAEVSKRTLDRARRALGVKADKAGFDGGWRWALPEAPAKIAKPVAPFAGGSLGDLREIPHEDEDRATDPARRLPVSDTGNLRGGEGLLDDLEARLAEELGAVREGPEAFRILREEALLKEPGLGISIEHVEVQP